MGRARLQPTRAAACGARVWVHGASACRRRWRLRPYPGLLRGGAWCGRLRMEPSDKGPLLAIVRGFGAKQTDAGGVPTWDQRAEQGRADLT